MIPAPDNFASVLEPVAGENQWFRILPTTKSYDHFAEHAGLKAAAFIADCFRAHLGEDSEKASRASVFKVVLHYVRSGDIQAFVRLHDGNPQARFSFLPFEDSGAMH